MMSFRLCGVYLLLAVAISGSVVAASKLHIIHPQPVSISITKHVQHHPQEVDTQSYTDYLKWKHHVLSNLFGVVSRQLLNTCAPHNCYNIPDPSKRHCCRISNHCCPLTVVTPVVEVPKVSAAVVVQISKTARLQPALLPLPRPLPPPIAPVVDVVDCHPVRSPGEINYWNLRTKKVTVTAVTFGRPNVNTNKFE